MNTRSTPLSDALSSDTLQSTLLSSLLSGQSGGSGGLDLQSLLAAQAGGTNGGVDLAGLLAAQGGENGALGDDRLQLLMRWMEQRRTAESAPTEDTPDEAERELQYLDALQQEREQQAERRKQARELKHLMDSLYAEVETLRTRNDTLAAALGACYLCFGEDLACPECGGQGGAGSQAPDAVAFRQYVAPAVRRIRSAHTMPPGSIAMNLGKEHQS